MDEEHIFSHLDTLSLEEVCSMDISTCAYLVSRYKNGKYSHEDIARMFTHTKCDIKVVVEYIAIDMIRKYDTSVINAFIIRWNCHSEQTININ